MKLYIVRHGETVWNRLHKVQGAADIPLAEAGIRLARETGNALKNVRFDLCITSPLNRAKETAELILESQQDEVPIVEDVRIQEINFGKLEGVVCMNDNKEYINDDMRDFFVDPYKFKRPEGGENINDIVLRTTEFWNDLVNNKKLKDKTILITSHGCAVRALLQNVYHNPDNFWQGCVPPNCAVNIVEIKDGVVKILEKDKVYA